MHKWILWVFAAVMLAGCAGNQIDYNRSSLQLELGMSKDDVQSVMGPPRRTDVNQERERWIYWNPAVIGFTPVDNEQLAQDRLVVTFQEGKVVRWGNQTYADDIMEASQRTMESSYELMRQSAPPQQ